MAYIKLTSEQIREDIIKQISKIQNQNNDRLQNYIKALLEDPKGVVCCRCGQINDMFDDCGFFYWDNKKKKEYRPVCNKCFNRLGLSTAER